MYYSQSTTKTYDYIGDFVYLNNTIQHFAHEEGRTAWDGGTGDPYDEYFYKDHLGNVRQVIRAPFTLAFRATMEEEYAQEEEQLFEQLPETRILDHRHNNTAGGNQVAWLNAERGKMLGPSRTQEVQEGDSLTLEVDVIFDKKRKGILHPSALIKSGSQTLWKDRLLEGVQNLNFSPKINPMLIYEFTRLLLAEIESKKTPESYLMYALYDQDSVLYYQGKVLVSNAAANEHEQLRQTLKVKKNGYLETFVVNETAQNIFFDNLKVQSTSPIIVQENAYYPFGMTIAGLDYSYNNHTNRYLYNGKELISDLNLGLYDYGARFYDPAIGRFPSVDPKAHLLPSWSPYVFSLNNPILFIDPDGQFPYTFHVRAFAPTGSFKGSGFHDDGRGFSTNAGASSRIKQNFTVDPTAQTFSGGTPTSDPTYWNGINTGTATNKGGISTPEFGANSLGSATASLSSNFEGSNPAFKGLAPNIEVSSALSITENLEKGQVTISFDLSSKQFPATEGFVQDAAGNSVFLGGAAAFGSAGNLVNADKKQVSTIDLIIGINDKGVFQNVTMGGTTYSLDDFNNLRTSKPAGPFPREDKDK